MTEESLVSAEVNLREDEEEDESVYTSKLLAKP
jgi:hypothetical protein